MGLILALFLFAGVALGGAVAEVDGEKITKEEFTRLFNIFWKRVSHLSSAKPTKKVKKSFLVDYVSAIVILKEAKRMGITVSEGELRAYMRKYVGKVLEDKPLLKLVKAEILTNKIMEKLAEEESITVSEGELRAYYEFYKRDFYFPPSVKLVAVYTKNLKEAQEAIRVLRSGGLPEGEGVRVGRALWYSLSALPGVVRKHFSSLTKGAVSEPIRVDGGYVVFKVLDRRGGGIIPFERAREMIKKRIIDEKRKEVFKEWFSEALKRYNVRFYWENL
ncbi:MAG: hypothetical protein GXO04_01050 [Aquificae bacterium]|nr:hypothetical protein [Aquificota bacterium]